MGDKKIVLIVNGDIKDIKEGSTIAKKFGFDGVMIGRGIFGKPWLFSAKGGPASGGDNSLIGTKVKIKALKEHIKLYQKLQSHRNFENMKKHFKSYINGFDGAKDLRVKLMSVKNLDQAIDMLNKLDYLK